MSEITLSEDSTKEEVAEFFVQKFRISETIKNNMIKEDISGDILYDISNDEFKSLGIKIGPLLKINKYLSSNKDKFKQKEITGKIISNPNSKEIKNLLEKCLNFKETLENLDGKGLNSLDEEQMKTLGLNLGQRKKLIKYFKTNSTPLLITKSSTEKEVAEFLKMRLKFSQDSIDELKLDGESLYLLKENGLNDLKCLTHEEKENLEKFLEEIELDGESQSLLEDMKIDEYNVLSKEEKDKSRNETKLKNESGQINIIKKESNKNEEENNNKEKLNFPIKDLILGGAMLIFSKREQIGKELKNIFFGRKKTEEREESEEKEEKEERENEFLKKKIGEKKDEEINEEYIINEDNEMIDYEKMKEIMNSNLDKSICKIIIKNNKKIISGSGFFIKISSLNIKGFMTVNHLIDQSYNEKQLIYFQEDKNGEKENSINLNVERFRYSDKELDFTFIEILEIDNISNFLEIDENIMSKDYKNEKIFSINFPLDEKLQYSHGKYLKKKEKYFMYTIGTKAGSSGAPIFLVDNLKIIGLHKAGYQNKLINIGIPMDLIINKLSDIYNKENKSKIDKQIMKQQSLDRRDIIAFNDNIDNTDNIDNPITEITFSLGESLDECYNKLKKNNYNIIKGDIRKTCGGKYGVIGIKKSKDYKKAPITDIVGIINYENQPDDIKHNGYLYHMVKDLNGNGNIHYEEGGVCLFLYYSTDNKKRPIKDLKLKSYESERKDSLEVVQKTEKSYKNEIKDLDLATMRGFRYNKTNPQPANYNYLYIYRLD